MVGGAAPAGLAGDSVVTLVSPHGSCSGVALASSLVLTAAHCVRPGFDYKIAEYDNSNNLKLKDVAVVRRHPGFDATAAELASNAASSPGSSKAGNSMAGAEKKSVSTPDAGAVLSKEPVPPEGGLLVYENGREVFRMPPAVQGGAASPTTANESGVQRAAAVEPAGIVEISPEAAEGSLLHRVEPEYPQEAREQRIEGRGLAPLAPRFVEGLRAGEAAAAVVVLRPTSSQRHQSQPQRQAQGPGRTPVAEPSASGIRRAVCRSGVG